MTHGSTTARLGPAADEVDEPLRSVTAQNQTARSGSIPWHMILRPFVASWPLLAAGLIAGAVLAYVMQSRTPLTYTAEALVAPNRTRTQVQFVPQIKTLDDTANSSFTAAVSPERRQALVDLVHSSNVEAQSINDLNGKLPSDVLQRGVLIQQIGGGIRPRSEILTIQAISATPTDAILIANTWARNYVNEVNRLYSPAASDNSIETLRDHAARDLEVAQSNLSQSMGTSQLEALDQQIRDKQAQLTLVQSPYQALTSAAQDSGKAGPPNTQNQGATQAFNDYRLADRRILDDLAQTLRKVEATRETVRALRRQAEVSGSGGSSNGAALALRKTQLVTIADGLPSQLQLQLPSDSGAVSAADLQALATSLDTARDELAREFDARRIEYEQRSAEQVRRIAQDLQNLRSRYEAADAERKRLTAARDLASDTYTALSKKAEEQRVANITAGHEVEMASEATFATLLPRHVTPVLVIGALLGLLAGTALALLRWFVPLRTGALQRARLSSPQPTNS